MYSFIYIFKPTYYTETKLSAEPEVICHPSTPATKNKETKNKCVFPLLFSPRDPEDGKADPNSKPMGLGFRVEGFEV